MNRGKDPEEDATEGQDARKTEAVSGSSALERASREANPNSRGRSASTVSLEATSRSSNFGDQRHGNQTDGAFAATEGNPVLWSNEQTARLRQQSTLAEDWSFQNRYNSEGGGSYQGYNNCTDNKGMDPIETKREHQTAPTSNEEDKIRENVNYDPWLDLADAWKGRNSDPTNEGEVSYSPIKTNEGADISQRAEENETVDWQQQLANDWAKRNRDATP